MPNKSEEEQSQINKEIVKEVLEDLCVHEANQENIVNETHLHQEPVGLKFEYTANEEHILIEVNAHSEKEARKNFDHIVKAVMTNRLIGLKDKKAQKYVG